MTGIDPEIPFFRRIDDPSYLARRSEPEPYMLDSEPAVYYTETPEGGSILVKRAMTGLSADGDTDGVPDVTDNCLLLPNADQRDTNGDRYGNLCDPDLNDSGIVNFRDLGLFRQAFFTNDPDADFNGDGVVNAIDLGTLQAFFFMPPGPSGLAQ